MKNVSYSVKILADFIMDCICNSITALVIRVGFPDFYDTSFEEITVPLDTHFVALLENVINHPDEFRYFLSYQPKNEIRVNSTAYVNVVTTLIDKGVRLDLYSMDKRYLSHSIVLTGRKYDEYLRLRLAAS